MTLGGLALAVGVLVDEGTVLLENIHVHLAQGEPKARAVLEASREVAIPRLLAMLSVLAVFLPSFFMVGPARSLFVPLSLAVGFSMGASYLLSSSLVPVLSNWLLKAEKVHAESSAEARFDRFRKRFYAWLDRLMAHPALLLGVYCAGGHRRAVAGRTKALARNFSFRGGQSVSSALRCSGRHTRVGDRGDGAARARHD